MPKLSLILGGAAIALGGLAMPSAPALAQTAKVSEIIVYGTDPCPRSTQAEVVVCVRRGEEERYRIPENYRGSGPRQLGQAWTNQARSLEMVSDTGTFSCSAVGPGGHTGCLEQLIRQSQGQRGEAADASTPPQ